MDNTKVSRENLDKLLDFVTKEKYIGWMEKVKTFAQNEPTYPLNEAEAFLLMLSTTEGLIDSLKLWQIKEDCEEMEREICQPLFNIKTSIDMIKASKELALILNTTLQVVNFLKNTQYKAGHSGIYVSGYKPAGPRTSSQNDQKLRVKKKDVQT